MLITLKTHLVTKDATTQVEKKGMSDRSIRQLVLQDCLYGFLAIGYKDEGMVLHFGAPEEAIVISIAGANGQQVLPCPLQLVLMDPLFIKVRFLNTHIAVATIQWCCPE